MLLLSLVTALNQLRNLVCVLIVKAGYIYLVLYPLVVTDYEFLE